MIRPNELVMKNLLKRKIVHHVFLKSMFACIAYHSFILHLKIELISNLCDSVVPARYVELPVWCLSLLKWELFHVLCVDPLGITNICISDQCDRTPPVIYHGEHRSGLADSQQHQSICVSYLG